MSWAGLLISAWLVWVSFPGNPGLVFPSGNPSLWNPLYVKAPGGWEALGVRGVGAGSLRIPRWRHQEHLLTKRGTWAGTHLSSGPAVGTLDK